MVPIMSLTYLLFHIDNSSSYYSRAVSLRTKVKLLKDYKRGTIKCGEIRYRVPNSSVYRDDLCIRCRLLRNYLHIHYHGLLCDSWLTVCFWRGRSKKILGYFLLSLALHCFCYTKNSNALCVAAVAAASVWVNFFFSLC